MSSFNIQAQVSNRLLPVQNVHLNVSPNNFVYTVPPTDNRFYVASMDALRLKTFNVSGFNDTVKAVGDIRYKSISYVPSWSDVTSKPDLRTKTQNDTYYKDILYVPSWTEVTGKPTFSIVATSGSYTDLLSKPVIPTNTNQLTNGSGFLTAEVDGSVTNELQTLSVSGNNISISSGNTVALPQASTSVVTRSLNTNFTPSTTRFTLVSYSVACQVTNPLLVGTSTATAFLEYSTNSGTTWLNASQVANSSGVGLTVTVQLTNSQTGTLVGGIPANALVRIRTATTGTGSVTYVTGNEVNL